MLLSLFFFFFLFSRGRYLVALGRSWHPEEFTCSQCKAVLEEGGFFEERGAVYCTKCHDNRYAPNCAKCKKKIIGVRASVVSSKIKTAVSKFLKKVNLFLPPPPSGNHACTEDDLPCSVFQVCSLQESYQESSLLHGGGWTLLWERWVTEPLQSRRAILPILHTWAI